MKIAFLPLDARPVTRGAFLDLAGAAGIAVATPPVSLLGDRRRPADVELLWSWIEAEAADADLLIAAAELLIYGGLVPSRIGHESLERCLALSGRFAGLRRRHVHRRLLLSASNLRLPQAPDNSEEPEYWAEFGPRIFAYSYHADRFARTNDPSAWGLAEEARAGIPREVLADVLARRSRNLTVLLSLVDQAARGDIDGLLVGQDDAAEFGLTRRDLAAVETAIADRGAAARAWVTYGTDELGLRLLARARLAARGCRPEVRVVYAYPENRQAIPRYEGQALDRTVTSHIVTAGCRRVDAGGALTLFVHNFPRGQQEAPDQDPYDPAVLSSFLDALSAAAQGRERLAIADVRYSNGADRTFVARLLQAPRAYRTLAFGGWNTASNTVGMALAQAFLADGDAGERFTISRFLDDWGYQAGIRQRLAAEVVPRYPNATAQSLGPASGPCAEAARIWLAADYVPQLEWCFGRRIALARVGFPWGRLFEIDLELAVT
jgi:uncharacterized protein DUF4127